MRMNFQKSIGTSKGYTFIIVDDRLCLLYQYDFGDENNPIMLEKLNNLSHELANIQAQSNGSSGYDNTNQALMMSLEMLSEYNKNFLNK